MYRVFVLAEIVFDIRESFLWYEKQQNGLEKEFKKDINTAFSYISKEPYLIQKRYRNIHIYFMKVFSYGIHYVIERNDIRIIAVFHTSKSSRSWSRYF